jgi:hypothetical protein
MQGFRKIKRALQNRTEAVSVSVAWTQARENVFLSTVSRHRPRKENTAEIRS